MLGCGLCTWTTPGAVALSPEPVALSPGAVALSPGPVALSPGAGALPPGAVALPEVCAPWCDWQDLRNVSRYRLT